VNYSIAQLKKDRVANIVPRPFVWRNTNFTFKSLNTTMVGDKRFYHTPYGLYPSVTTILSISPKETIEQWKKAVGEKEAKRISGLALRHGKELHDILEKYLGNEPFAIQNAFLLNSFKKLQKILDKSVDNIHALETPLFSKFLKAAGQVDCIAEFNKRLSVIDFKTAKDARTEKDIESYFMQTSAYAVMFEEMTGTPISNLVIIMAVELGDPLVFVKRRDDYIWDFVKVRGDFDKT